MAIQFLTGLNIDGNIDLNSNQLKEVRIDNIGSAPTGSLGRIYYDTSSNKLRLYNGGWVDIDTGTDGDTTYELFGVGSTNGSAGIQLDGSDGTLDNVLIVGAGTVGVTRSGNTLTVTGTDSAVGTVTSVSGGTGISVSGSATVTPTVNIDYAGADNAILVATAATPVGTDTLWFSDASDSTIKRSLISAMPGFVILVTVPPELLSACQDGKPLLTFNTCPAEPIPNLANVELFEAYSISPAVKLVKPVPPEPVASNPPKVNVPLVVMAPPVNVNPVDPPDPSTLVTVPPPIAEVICEIFTYLALLSVASLTNSLSDATTVTPVPSAAANTTLSVPA